MLGPFDPSQAKDQGERDTKGPLRMERRIPFDKLRANEDEGLRANDGVPHSAIRKPEPPSREQNGLKQYENE